MTQMTNNGKRVQVRDWMSTKLFVVETFDSIAVARQLMAKQRVNQLPVTENETLVGIVTDRDIRDAYPTSMLINRGKEIDEFAEKITVEEVMSHNVFVVKPDTNLSDAVKLLRKHRIGSLPVLDNKELVGIITRSDILDFVLSGGQLAQAKVSNKSTKKGRGAKKRKK
ncbi:MAG: CBS domain-containing protein [Deltaproteobacteria bacterium]|nr:CBS domain-containing protein [Deltaproteobacteria bacterium]